MDLNAVVLQVGLEKNVKKTSVTVTLTLVLITLNVLIYFKITFVYVLLALMVNVVKLHHNDVLVIHVNMEEIVATLVLVSIVVVPQNIRAKVVNMSTILVSVSYTHLTLPTNREV